MARAFQVTFDAHDPDGLAGFWAAVLDYEYQPPPPEFETWDEFADRMGIPPERRNDISAIVDPAGVGPRLLFLKVPEGKTAKNRVHLDVHSDADRTATTEAQLAAMRPLVDRLKELGATEHDSFDEMGSVWIVMQDPEGNEFCIT